MRARGVVRAVISSSGVMLAPLLAVIDPIARMSALIANIDVGPLLVSYHERHAGNSLGDSPACHSWHEGEAILIGRQRLLVW